jgi:NAD(P)-dependent dehydrogenase (short-subunit alcohol dehydrogenase family)
MRIALTGGTAGIGAAVAAKLKIQGHHVTAFDVSEPQDNVDHWIALDLGDPQAIADAIAKAEGPFDALINNAGLPPRDGLEEMILKVNYFGLRAFMDGMLDKLVSGARIVNVASRAGAMWRDNLDEVKALMVLDVTELTSFITERRITPTRAYNLSKEAVIVMTMAETQAMIARGFSMNSVSPAAVSTGILQDFATAFGDKMAKNVARAGRPGHPSEIADLIAFLASPESAWIKGQDLIIDGGMGAMGASDAMDLPQSNNEGS